MERALSSGDLLLRLSDGRSLTARSHFLAMASPIMEEALQCQPALPCNKRKRDAEQEQVAETAHAPRDVPFLSVEGDYDGWVELLSFLYYPSVTGKHLPLSLAAAFKVLPIAHAYNMEGLLANCVETVRQSTLPLGPLGPLGPQAPVQQEQPSLLQWLALGDAKQHAPLVHARLDQLTSQGEALPVARSALACPQARAQLDGLCSGTLMELLNVTAGLPRDFKGMQVPDLSRPPAFVKKVVDGMPNSNGCGCLSGQLLLLPREQAVEVFCLEDGTSFSLDGHDVDVRAIACSTDGQRAASETQTGSLWVWDINARQCRHKFEDHLAGHEADDAESGKAAVSVCFCGDHRVATGLESCRIRVWDLATGVQIGPDLAGHSGQVFDVKARDSNVLISASHDSCIKLWDLRVRESDGCVRTLTGHAKAVASIGLGADGRTAVSASWDANVKSWDVGSGRCIHTLSGHANLVYNVYMDSAATAAVSLGNDETVRVWSLSVGTLAATHSWSGKALLDLCCSADLSRIAVVVEEEDGDACCVEAWLA